MIEIKEHKAIRILFIALYAFLAGAITLFGIVMLQSLRILLLSLFCIFLGWLTASQEGDFKSAILTNELILMLLMALTRLASFTLSGDIVVLDPLNILESFILYSVLSGFTSIVVCYVKE